MAGFMNAPLLGRPHPHDISIHNGTEQVGYRCGVRRTNGVNGPLLGISLPGMEAQPSEYKLGAENPRFGTPFAQSRFSGGFGQRYIREREDVTRYWWGIGVDMSIEGYGMLGPEITTVTPDADVDSTNGVTPGGFFEMSVAGTKKLFMLNGRYVKVRNGDAAGDWDTSKDLGAGNAATGVIVHAQNTGTGGTTYAYVAIGDGSNDYIWRYDGTSDTTTWTQHTSLQALCFAKSGKHLYRAHSTNLVSRVDNNADPWTAANWGAANQFRVGDATSAIRNMLVHPDGTLFVFKGDGVYVLDDDGEDVQLYGGLKFTPNDDNGKHVWLGADGNSIHCTYGGIHYRILPGGALDPIGPERLVENNTDVRGYITTGIGQFVDYAAIYNPDSGESYLLKFGAWEAEEDGQVHLHDHWHGSISSQFANLKITAMYRSTCGADSGHERLYFGTSTGIPGWFALPCTSNPAACTSYRFRTTTGYLYTSIWDGGYPLTNKHVKRNELEGAVADANKTITAYYAVNQGATTGGAGGIGAGFTASGAVLDATPGDSSDMPTDVVGLNISWELRFATNVNTASPILCAYGFTYALRPTVTFAYEVLILAEDGLVRRDGGRYDIGAKQIRANLLAFATRVGGRAVFLPHMPTESGGTITAQQMSCIGYEETVAWDPEADGGKGRWRAAIALQLVQNTPRLVNYGAAAGVLGT